MSEKINEWLKLAVKNENFLDYTVQIHGNSGKADGYLGKIVFLTITGKTKSHETKTLNLVMKTSSQSEKLRNQISIKLFFQREIHVYSQIIPEFYKLQKESEVDLLDFVPKCYATKEEENIEIVILENLKPEGYDLWDRKMPMTLDHVKLVLENFGKWHALSMVLKHKKREIFNKLVENNVNMFPHHILRVGMSDTIWEFLEEVKNSKFAAKFHEIQELQLSKEEVKDIFVNSFNQDPVFHAVLHGDCWTNNFLFKLDGNKPLHVAFIDWQCASLSSPVMDLSFFIYTCVDTKIYNKVRDLLQIYYESFSKTVANLNCSTEIYSFDKLEEHWKKFSIYGLLIGTFMLKFSLCDAEDAPDFVENAEQGKEFIESLKFTLKNKEKYFSRVTNNLLHYIRNLK